ncbi:demethylmenaquinone methyltransferase-like isoform X4 [Eriocheir sinensis]|uniref:demethylmenaquinone methyltransferase-like isoform X4 n=1 Tax=Eriocheir sinensis TaxID=95602 RepID=UPI0021C81894|nr:demethylmenaquinone methyltransferase-like isoform X4 [Eriocheir sinensis]XP_050708789.1 demethylmenaquinone methyltransferase-like isoform X4 [Eriocheir sinensis]
MMAEGYAVNQAAKRVIKDVFVPGITAQEVKDIYDKQASYYDEMLQNSNFRAPAITLEEVLRRVPPEKRGQTRVLDVAAGTGWVGRELHREGFRFINAVEPSEGMIKKLRESGVYTNDFMEFIGTGHSTVPKDTYDLVTISSGMGEGHIPVSGLDDLVQVAKKGECERDCFFTVISSFSKGRFHSQYVCFDRYQWLLLPL